MITRCRYIISLFCSLVFVFTSCKTLERVEFPTPVDTKTKKITDQIKKTYHLADLGVYASNQFKGARLNNFYKKNDSTAIAIILPENTPINNSAYYAFDIWSSSPKTIYVELKYPEPYDHRYQPKLKTHGSWILMDTSNVKVTDHAATIKLQISKDKTTVAAQELQVTSDVIRWYSDLIKDNPKAKLNSAGKSMRGRNIPVIDIYDGDAKGKDIVVLLTRQHPPEVTGYYAYQYFLETILDKQSTLANKFLQKYRVITFPLINPDGVDLGHWRHNAGGIDTNRDWSRYEQPEIKQVVKYITKELKKSKSKIVLGLDFHSTYEDVFYTNQVRNETTLPTFIRDWFLALEENIDGYIVNEKSSNSTKPVSKGWFLYGHEAVGITYEIGDNTPKERIKTIGKISSKEMMGLLLTYK